MQNIQFAFLNQAAPVEELLRQCQDLVDHLPSYKTYNLVAAMRVFESTAVPYYFDLDDTKGVVQHESGETRVPAIPHHHMSDGDAAQEAFYSAINSALQDDAVGTIVGYKLEHGIPWIVDLRVKHESFSEFAEKQYDLIIVDSGNAAGDVWKYIYHPQQRVGVFINEYE